MSRETLAEHRRIWARKPVLADVYADWFERLLAPLPRGARVVEAGAGPGFLAEHARRLRPDLRYVATDLLAAAPGCDVAADALRLPFRGGSLDAVLVLDVIHHLGRPWDFFAEAARCLRRGGQLLAVEPWVSPFSYPIYRYLHQEGCTRSLDPQAPFGTGGKQPFDGDAAVLWKLLRTASAADWTRCGLSPPEQVRLNGFAYLLSLGFRDASLLPRPLAPAMRALDRALAPLAPLLAMRVFAKWTRV